MAEKKWGPQKKWRNTRGIGELRMHGDPHLKKKNGAPKKIPAKRVMIGKIAKKMM